MIGKPKAKKRKSQISPWSVILKIEMNSKIFCGFLSLFCFHLKLTLESFIQRKISTKEFKQKKALKERSRFRIRQDTHEARQDFKTNQKNES